MFKMINNQKKTLLRVILRELMKLQVNILFKAIFLNFFIFFIIISFLMIYINNLLIYFFKQENQNFLKPFLNLSLVH
jgi:lipid II:glycine glycyltransferase (peptidoglycan interpeptide bridge formation enzyme)